MADAEGVRVILTPVQLATMIQEIDVSEHALAARFWGGMKVLGGALELVGAAALLAAPEPTMATKVGGGALALHGSDTTSTGLRQLWTGRDEKTLTQQSVAAVAQAMGADPPQADKIGMIVDIAVPLVAAAGVSASRIAAIRAGRISLLEEETAGGHTIAKHVGRTESQLRARLVAERNIPAASSFKTLDAAEGVVSEAIQANVGSIRQWAVRAAVGDRFRIVFNSTRVVGYGVVRATNRLQDMKKVLVVLEKTNIGGKIYFVLTSFPVP
jgi:hypothetical protein